MPRYAPASLAAAWLIILNVPGTSAQGQEIRSVPAGIVAVSRDTTLQVSALREDVLRVRIWRGSAAPEDASWAVLPSARTSTTAITRDAHGFSTPKLHITIEADLRLRVTDTAGNVLQEDAAPVGWDGFRFTVAKKRETTEHFYGLGDKPGPLDRSGEAFTMWNTDSFGWQESTDPIYKDIPFFLTLNHGRTLGVFLDNTWRTNFDFGRADPQQYTFGALNGPVDYYLIYGPDPKQVVTAWAWLTGPTPLPPLWALGFQQSRYTYYPESQLREVADRLRQDRIPCDVLWLDIDFQHNNWPFTVNDQAYPDFPGMVKDLANKDFKLVVITDLHIAKQPNVGYAPYDSGTAGDHFVKNPDGTVYSGKVWPGASVFPDFTQAQTRQWWGTLYTQFVKEGVAGFWNDMNEPSVFDVPSKTMPDDVQHRIEEHGFRRRTATHLEMHNVYGMENTRATYEGQLALRPNERPFVMTRASYAGGQRYSATWTGDNSSTWNHLRMTVPQLVNLGLSGFSLAGADVGGFAGSPSPALLTKWLEISAFQPIDRDHSAKGTRPHEVWVDGPEQEAIRKRYIEERYKLMPYLYTVAEETSRDGLPMNRPLFLEFPHANSDGEPFDSGTGGGEFMLGSDVLIAPNPSPEEVASYTVALPPGTWYNYWSGERYVERQPGSAVDLEQRDVLLARKRLSVSPTLEDLPVYIRGGSVLPLAPLTQSTATIPNGPLTLRVYPLSLPGSTSGKACEGDVYTDDGHSFDYRHGAYARIHVTCVAGTDGSLRISIGKQEGTWKPWWSAYRIELVGWSPTQKVATVAGKPVKLEQAGDLWAVSAGVNPDGLEFVVR